MPKKKEKTRDNKKIVLISIALIAFIAAIVFIIMTINNKKETETFKIDGIDITENRDILKDTKVDTLNITNQVLYNQNDMSTFSAIINNDSDSDFYIKELYVIFTVNEETKKILVTKDTTIKTKDNKAINVSFDSDMLKTTKIEYELIK